MVLNTRTRRVTITNFCLGKHLIGDRDLLRDQRGSPAYISPDVLSGAWDISSTGWLGWLRGPAVGRRSLAGVLSLSFTRPVADG